MASIRRGYSDDFTLNNNPSGFRKAASSSVGIGTSVGQEALDVVDGSVKGQDLKVTGISSFTAYEGFLRANHQIAENTTLSFDQGPSASLSGEIIVGTGVTVTIASVGVGTTMVGVGTHTIENTIDTTDVTRAGGSEIECLKVFNTFTPPSGGTNERPPAPKPGELYYNYDFKTIEFFDGNGWRQVDNTTRSGRALTSGGGTTDSQYLESFNINTLGNASYFGDMFQARNEPAGFGDATRAIFAGGSEPSAVNTIDYNTIASEGKSIDFGDRTETGYSAGAVSSSTRGVMAGGWSPGTPRTSGNTEVIDFVEISTVGSAVDFGDLKPGGSHGMAAAQSPTRGIFAGGYFSTFPATTSPYSQEFIGSISIASKGNTIKFGELNVPTARADGCSNSVRGIFAGGYKDPSPGYLSRIEYITIASDGNGTIFGDLSTGRPGNAMTSTQTRAVIMGGRDDSTNDCNIIEYITIATTGDAIDFGDLSIPRRRLTATSDSHGGLGGF